MSRRQQLLCAALVAAACGPRVLDSDESDGEGDGGESDGDSGAADPDPDPDPPDGVSGDPPDDPPPDLPDTVPELELCPLAPQVVRVIPVDIGMPIVDALAFVRITGETSDALLYSVAYSVLLARPDGDDDDDETDIDGISPFGASAFAVGDIEPDGDADIVMIQSALRGTGDYLRVYPQLGPEDGDTFGEVAAIEVNDATALALADYDGDGSLELFSTEEEGVIVRHSDGESFGGPALLDAPSPALITVRDESAEIDAIGYQVEQIYVTSNAGGDFAYRLLPGSSPALPERRLYASDLDGDLIDDVIAIDIEPGATHASAWWGAQGEWYPSQWSIAGELPFAAAADLDLDGRSDLALGGPDGLAIVFGSDAQIVGESVRLAGCMTWLDSPIAVLALAIGDYDGDGFRDIAVTDGAAIVVLSLV